MPQTDKVLRETLSVLKRIVFVGMLIRSEVDSFVSKAGQCSALQVFRRELQIPDVSDCGRSLLRHKKRPNRCGGVEQGFRGLLITLSNLMA